MTRKLLSIISIVIFSIIIGMVKICQATILQPTLNNPLSNTANDLLELRNLAPQILTSAAIIIFVIVILVGGFSYMGAGGNSEATEKAKRILFWGIIGLVVVFIGVAAINLIYGSLTTSPTATPTAITT